MCQVCDRFIVRETKNANLTCLGTLLASEGVRELRNRANNALRRLESKPRDGEVMGGAEEVHVLDALRLTNAPGACDFTAEGDGRHFMPLVFLVLRALVDGLLGLRKQGG